MFQLEFNLIELGYDPDEKIVLDGTFNKHTEAAVERWQAATGTTEDGIVLLGEAVFLIGERRLSLHRAQVGETVQPGSPILELSSPIQIVTLDLPADRQDLLALGDTVEIELPNDERIGGTVQELGRVAISVALPDGTPTEPVVNVTIRPDAMLANPLDQAPVDIFVTKTAAEDVLVVPVTALVAVKGGGYAVEVAEGADTSLVRVVPGLYADGLVEITGDVSDGTRVVVPR